MMRVLRQGLTFGLLLTVAACARQSTDAGPGSSTGSERSAPVVSTGLPRPTGAPHTGANRVSPDPTAVDLRPVAWTRAEVAAGGSLSIYYTAGGLPTCTVLGRVDLTETATTVIVTVLLGQTPEADCNGPQPMLAAAYVTTITLHQPLGTRTVLDGAPPTG